MKDSLLKLISEEYVVLDGGMGTFLQDKGLTSGDLPEEWNISHPDVIKKIHLDYLIAGAQIIETNTFGASPIKLEMNNKENLTKDFNIKASEIAIDALKTFRDLKEIPGNERKENRFISGSIGPSGKILGMDINKSRVEKSYAMQGKILAESGVNLFNVETMLDLNESVLAVKTLKKETNLPVFATLVFNKTKKGDLRTLFGNTIPDVVNRLIEAGADAMGANCGLIDDYIEVIKRMKNLTDYPLVIFPNAGLPKLKDNRTYFEQTPEFMIDFLDKEIEAGATIIGGCCGTTPNYVEMIAERIKHKMRGK